MNKSCETQEYSLNARIPNSQKEYLERLKKKYGLPSIASAIRMLINNAMEKEDNNAV